MTQLRYTLFPYRTLPLVFLSTEAAKLWVTPTKLVPSTSTIRSFTWILREKKREERISIGMTIQLHMHVHMSIIQPKVDTFYMRSGQFCRTMEQIVQSKTHWGPHDPPPSKYKQLKPDVARSPFPFHFCGSRLEGFCSLLYYKIATSPVYKCRRRFPPPSEFAALENPGDFTSQLSNTNSVLT